MLEKKYFNVNHIIHGLQMMRVPCENHTVFNIGDDMLFRGVLNEMAPW